MSKIVVIDYGMGNLFSVKKSFGRIGINVTITNNPTEIKLSDKIILPGVGHFKKAVQNLKSLGIWDILNEKVLVNKTPILGICLGMQLMANRSEEGDAQGFGWFDAEVVKFKVKDKLSFKVPHTGWNQIIKKKESKLMLGIPDFSEFYFVHSYHISCKNTFDVLNETDYEYKFPSAIEKDNLFGVQYHPEKSHDVGERLLLNFSKL